MSYEYQKCPACKIDCKLTEDDKISGLNECANTSCAVQYFYVNQVKIRNRREVE